MNCSNGYFANLSAGQYLDLYGPTTNYGYCAPAGLFNARIGYQPVFGFDANISNDYGLVPSKQFGNCSPPAVSTGWAWDFTLPCNAHDYCYDLRKAGFSGTVSDSACDNAFYSLMEADCNNRVFGGDCRIIRNAYYTAVALPGVVTDPDPAAVQVKAFHSSKCADVTGSSLADNASIVQYTCTGTSNQRFKFTPSDLPGYFWIVPSHSGKCADLNASTNKLAQWGCGAYTEQRFSIQGSFSQNIYTIRSQYHGSSWCWDVAGSSTANLVQLAEYSCFETSNQRWILS